VPKPEGWRLIPASYPVQLICDTRFQDMDVNGHLNNVAFAALFENARVHFHSHAGIRDNRDAGEQTMVAAVEINYLAEGNYPKPVTIASAIGRIGNSSWQILQAMFQEDRCIATCDTVVACRARGAAMLLRPELRAGLESVLVAPGL
jgi:acyl-CoA thioester hydrolase